MPPPHEHSEIQFLSDVQAAVGTAENPIELEAVPEVAARSGLRFGVRSMLVMTAVCAGQFALIYYLGAFAGMAIGVGAGFLVLLCVIVTAVLYRPRRRTRFLRRLDQIAVWLSAAIFALLVGMMLTGGGRFLLDQLAEYHLSSALSQELGFTLGHETVMEGAGHVEALQIEDVEPGGPFDKAGFREGDVIVQFQDSQEFFRYLEDHRGEEITITVARDVDDFTPLSQSNKTDITIKLPP